MSTSPEPPLYDRSFASAFVAMVGFVLASALMAHFARWVTFLDGDVQEIGWITGAGPVASLVLRPWLGQWINRLGARTVWVAGIVLFATGCLGNLLVYDLGLAIYLLRGASVLGTACVFTSSLAYIAQIAPPHRRTEAIGTLGAAGFIGMLMGPWLGDLILGAGGRTRVDFVLYFCLAAGSACLPLVLLLNLRKTDSAHRSRPTRAIDFASTVRAHWPGWILLVVVCFGLSMAVPFNFLAKFIDEAHDPSKPAVELGIYFVGYGGWGLTVRLLMRRVPDLVGRRKMLILGLTFSGFGFLSINWIDASQPWNFIVPGLIGGTGHALAFPTMTSLTIEAFPKHVTGTGTALHLLCLDLGTVAGGPLLGNIADRLGFAALFATVGCSSLAVALVYTLASVPVWRERYRRRVAQAGTAKV